jgi:hypothetical protein
MAAALPIESRYLGHPCCKRGSQWHSFFSEEVIKIYWSGDRSHRKVMQAYPWYASNGITSFRRNDGRFNSVVVALPSCAHLGPLEFPPLGTNFTKQEMSSTISLLMVVAKTFLRNLRLTSISGYIFIHAVHFRDMNLAYLCCMWSEYRSFFRRHTVLTISLKFSRPQTCSWANSYAFQESSLFRC